MESLLHDAARHVALALQAVAIIVVTVGSARVLVEVGRLALVAGGGDEARGRAAWLGYARWLVAGLTFQLAADIVSTSFAPSWDDVGRLAAVAAIRTFLSYFLDHEMESSRKLLRVSPPSDKRMERVGRGD